MCINLRRNREIIIKKQIINKNASVDKRGQTYATRHIYTRFERQNLISSNYKAQGCIRIERHGIEYARSNGYQNKVEKIARMEEEEDEREEVEKFSLL